jgi:hypothetical protein
MITAAAMVASARVPYAEALRTHRLACAGLIGGHGPVHAASGGAGGARTRRRGRAGGRGTTVTGARVATEGAQAAGQGTERNVVVEGPGRVAVREEPRRPVPAGAFRVTTLFSDIASSVR